LTILQISYLAVLLLAVAVALWRGGWPERTAALAVLAASFASPLVESSLFASPEYGILAVDLLLLGWLGALALATDRFWPLWATGFHLVGTIIHVARMVDPTVVPPAYAMGQVFWSYPVLGALAWGALVEARAAKAPLR
jgi:hypothetical protein